MINLLMSRYFSRTTDEEFFNSIESWGILGFNWLQVLKNLQVRYKGGYKEKRIDLFEKYHDTNVELETLSANSRDFLPRIHSIVFTGQCVSRLGINFRKYIFSWLISLYRFGIQCVNVQRERTL